MFGESVTGAARVLKLCYQYNPPAEEDQGCWRYPTTLPSCQCRASSRPRWRPQGGLSPPQTDCRNLNLINEDEKPLKYLVITRPSETLVGS